MHIHRVLLTSSLLVLTLAIASPVHATESTSSGKTRMGQEIREKAQAVRQEVRSTVAQAHSERLQKHFELYVTRLTKIADRIQTRIDKEKTEGKDVTSAQTALTASRTKLAQASTDGTQAVAAFAAIDATTWDEQKAQAVAAKELAKKARTEFVEARKLMVDAVQALATN